MNQARNQDTPMAFQPFALEQYQSLYEHTVEINLADSSVKCLTVREWLSEEAQQRLLDTELYYPQVNGTVALRQRIAALYPGATADNVLVTVGASEANKLVCEALLHPGDEVVVMSPGYRQVWGLATNLGCVVKELVLRPEHDWRPNLDELDALVTERTKLVAIVNPNNPTGLVLTPTEMQRIVAACSRVGAWLHADEVYVGTERPGADETATFWGQYDRLICTNSVSKAYGLSGLRIGWAVASQEMIEALWRRHEYAVIAAAAPSMLLTTEALHPAKRQELFGRQRTIAATGWKILSDWIVEQGAQFSVRPSSATGIAFVRYNLPISSYDFAEHLRRTANVLVAPGAFLGTEYHVRLAVGYSPTRIQTALDRIAAATAQL